MLNTILTNLDLVIAGVLVALAIIVLILNRLSLMPSKGTPYIIGAIIGIIGITAFNRAKATRLKKDVKKLEEQIARRQEEIDEAAKDLENRKAIVEQAEKEYKEALAQHKKNALAYVKPREEILKMNDSEIAAEFEKLL